MLQPINDEMKKYVANLRQEYQSQLILAAVSDLRAGLTLYHKTQRREDRRDQQASLGNLAISVELMLKAIIVTKNLLLVFKELPLEVRALLSQPENLPLNFNWRVFDIDLRAAKYKTIEFDECLTAFYLYFPDLKQQLHSHLRFLSTARNSSVHFTLPNFHKYEVERAVYVSLRIHEVLENLLRPPHWIFKAISYTEYVLSEEDKSFLVKFEGERLERVRKAIETAKESSRKLSGERSSIPSDGIHFVVKCPICNYDAVLNGYTEARSGNYDDEPGEVILGLDFFPSSFHCEACDLALNDIDELKLANFQGRYDRSDEIDRYMEGWGN